MLSSVANVDDEIGRGARAEAAIAAAGERGSCLREVEGRSSGRRLSTEGLMEGRRKEKDWRCAGKQILKREPKEARIG